MKHDILIRPYVPDDVELLWGMLNPIFRKGNTYAIESDITGPAAIAYWTETPREVWMAEKEGQPLGSYYVVRNQRGGGDHVCNCGFVTSPDARGQGIARAMLAHALKRAQKLGFEAMQFNFVLSSNDRAVDIWKRSGFDIVGTLPRAFDHPELGKIDAYVMYRDLTDQVL